MLIESHPDQVRVDLNNSYVLELRDLGRPQRVYREPFESRIEFAQASFGKEHVARRAGRGRSFVWPSLVRVGPEALRIVGDTPGHRDHHRHVEPQALSLGRPIRSIRTGASRSGDYPSPGQDPQVADGGAPLRQRPGRRDQPGRGRGAAGPPPPRRSVSKDGTMRSRFSRSSLYSFMIARSSTRRCADQPSGGAARAARIGCAAAPAQRDPDPAAGDAAAGAAPHAHAGRGRGIRLIWDLLGCQAGIGAERPQVAIHWDEASCTQFVWLYTEITQKFGGQPRGLRRD